MQRSRFISFEGGEGTGKSTQLRLLVERLRRQGVDAIATREPGGSPGAEALRALLVQGDPDRWSSLSEALILYAARADHLERTIRPALARGAWVVSDRFADSTRAYQGAGGGLSAEFIGVLEGEIVAATRPDLTLILDLPPEAGLARAGRRGGAEQRFEGKGLAFHQRLRTAFLEIAAREPSRCAVIAADAPEQAVADAVWEQVAARLLSPEPAA